MIKKSHYYSIGLLTIAILLTVLGYFFFIKTVWQKATSISLYKSDISFGDQKRKYAEDMLRSFEITQSDIDSLQNLFVKEQGEVEFIEFIEKTAKDRGLLVEIDTVSIDSSKILANHGMEYLLLRFNVNGSWSNVWNFSQILELLPYSINVDSLALMRVDTEKAKPTVWKGVYNIRVLKKK